MNRPFNMRRTLTLWVLAVTLTSAGIAQLGDVVVCLGNDGHVDIESAFENCCTTEQVTGDPEPSGPFVQQSDCGDCTDVQLRAPQLRSKELRFSKPAVGRFAEATSAGPNGMARSIETVDSDQHWHSLVPLSTVVLLT